MVPYDHMVPYGLHMASIWFHIVPYGAVFLFLFQGGHFFRKKKPLRALARSGILVTYIKYDNNKWGMLTPKSWIIWMQNKNIHIFFTFDCINSGRTSIARCCNYNIYILRFLDHWQPDIQEVKTSQYGGKNIR